MNDTLARDLPADRPQAGGHLAHIVGPREGVEGVADMDGAALCLEARVNGTPVTALCGATLVPSRDPLLCKRCWTCDEILRARCGPRAQPSLA